MWEKILYLDIAALPIYGIVWYSSIFRKMTKGRSNMLFLVLTMASFITVVSELIAGIFMQRLPIAEEYVPIIKSMEYIYFVMRHSTNVVYTFYFISVTRTWYRIRQIWKQVLLSIPFFCVMALLLTNEWTHIVFTVTSENGYQRGNYVLVVYALAAFYLIFGSTYLISCRNTLDTGAWIALFMMYFLNILAVFIQFKNPNLLIECYCTSVSQLFIVLFVQRPEKQMDLNTGLRGYRAFREEIEKIKVTGQDVQVIILCIQNAAEMNRFLGDTDYYAYIYTINGEIETYARKERIFYELYFEQPGSFYIIMEDMGYNPVQAIPDIRDRVRKDSRNILKAGALPDVRIVTIRFPKEISEPRALFRFGHNFVRFANVDKIYSKASDIIAQREYQIEANMDEILNRTDVENGFKITYEPIWSVSEQRAVSAEAVVLVEDEEFGEITEDQLFTAAEKRGYVIRLGNYLIEQVFAYVSRENLSELGYSHISIRLSVIHAMQMNLTDQIWQYREKYGVHPEQIGFAIRESAYENMSTVLDENMQKLAMQGYWLEFDGYGRGYSNMQRLLDLPLKGVRFDRRMLTAANTDAGKAMLKGSISMLKDIPMLVVAQGVDDEETYRMLIEMNCNYMQGKVVAGLLSGEKIL